MLDATVLIPTHDHGRLLRHAVASVLAQTVRRFELFILGDGATDETKATARELATSDPRISFFDSPKGPRNGEAGRHELLLRAQGRIVCYLSDDDLWLPDHLANMRALLARYDFAHSLPLRVEPGGSLNVWLADLTLPAYRQMLLAGENRVPLSCAGHTLDFYRQLPHGWRTTPAGIPTDLYMWQQFLEHPLCRAGSGTAPTVLIFPAPSRRTWPLEARSAELAYWSGRAPGLPTDPAFLRAVVACTARRGADAERHLRSIAGQAEQLSRVELERAVTETRDQASQAEAWRAEAGRQREECDRLRADRDLHSVARERAEAALEVAGRPLAVRAFRRLRAGLRWCFGARSA